MDAIRPRAALGYARPALGRLKGGQNSRPGRVQETRSGAEPDVVATALASAAVKRRKAGALQGDE
jgi:hypothetical protein